jgi:hypothetical protein
MGVGIEDDALDGWRELTDATGRRRAARRSIPRRGLNAPTAAAGDLDVSTSIEVVGVDPAKTVIDGMNSVRVVDVRPGGITNGGDGVAGLTEVTVARNVSPSHGGGIEHDRDRPHHLRRRGGGAVRSGHAGHRHSAR